MIWWNGVSSDDLGLYVEHYPERKLPERKTTFYSLPGRTGDYVYQQNAWNNYTQAYDIYISAEQRKLPNAMVAINAWLYSAQGYAKLEDSYDLDTYRMACFVGGQDIENMLNRYGRATIEFNCKPQRWLKSGEEWQDCTSSAVEVVNPTGLVSYPYVELTAVGDIYFEINGNTEFVAWDTTSALKSIDCETMDVSSTLADPYSNIDFYCNGIPSGKSVIYVPQDEDVTVTKCKFKPRWYTL